MINDAERLINARGGFKISRFWTPYSATKDFGLISAYQPNETAEKNKSAFNQLTNDLNAAKFGYIMVRVQFTADGHSNEQSCVFVPNLDDPNFFKQVLVTLAKKFHQSAVLLCNRNTGQTGAWLIRTNGRSERLMLLHCDQLVETLFAEIVRLKSFHFLGAQKFNTPIHSILQGMAAQAGREIWSLKDFFENEHRRRLEALARTHQERTQHIHFLP